MHEPAGCHSELCLNSLSSDYSSILRTCGFCPVCSAIAKNILGRCCAFRKALGAVMFHYLGIP